jgi:RiboL-PSP-HEPN
VQTLVSAPGKGRPPEVHALNSSAIALLSGHLQGFITDLYEEAARHLLTPHVLDVNAVVERTKRIGNPNAQNIQNLFASIGFTDVLDGISWQRIDNKAMRAKLRAFNELRNGIVHGKSTSVHKKQVALYMSAWWNLAERLDTKVGKVIGKLIGKDPW